MKARLVNSRPSSRHWEIEIEHFPVVIGQGPGAEIQPEDPSVSERHCELEAIQGRLMVRDLGSRCGTFVNGVRVDMALLLPGDQLTVGESSFVAAYDLPAAPAAGADDENRRRGDDDLGQPGDDVTFFDLIQLLDRQRETFRQQYLREPWQAEPMFPDPPHPEHIEHLIAEEMRGLGVEPQFIYAFEKTGVLLTELNYDTISQEQLDAWQSAIEEYEERHGCADEEHRYPVGAITMYGPNKSTTTMIVAATMVDEEAEPIYRRWMGSDVAADPKVKREITDFFQEHGVRTVIHVHENVGCPHQEGLDYPHGQDCPFCPYWKGRRQD